MSFRKLLPRGKISEETMQDLAPVFQGEMLYKKQEEKRILDWRMSS